MADNKNMELNEEIMANAAGGDRDRLRTEPGTVIGVYDESQSKFVVKRDQGPEAIASYYKIGPLLDPGTRVMIALVGMGKWEIIEVI